MHETLVIGSTLDVARSIAMFHVLRETAPEAIITRGGYRCVTDPSALSQAFRRKWPTSAVKRAYEWSPAHLAVRSMQGRRYDRIIIGGDWMRGPFNFWRLPEGGWVDLWYALEIQRSNGAERVWG